MKRHIIKSLESIVVLFFALTLIVACEDSVVLQDNNPPQDSQVFPDVQQGNAKGEDKQPTLQVAEGRYIVFLRIKPKAASPVRRLRRPNSGLMPSSQT